VGGRRRAVLRWSLIVVQVSLSFVLLVGAGLLLRSLVALRSISPGFSTRVLNTGVDLVAAGYDTQRMKNFEDALTDRLGSVAGVESVAFSQMTPFTFRSNATAPIAVDGYEKTVDEDLVADYNEVGPNYFATLEIPILAGREFTRADNETAPLVAVVNEAMAAQYWRGRDPVGSRLQVKGKWMTVVGVAKMSKYRNLPEPPKPFFYVAMRQNSNGTSIYIRTSLSTENTTKALVREIHALDTNLALGQVISMREVVDRMTAVQRAAVTMLGVFGALALVLAAIGLYGVLSYSVSQRSRELGLRMALGADASNLMRLVMSNGLSLTAGGVVLGLAVALGTTRLMGNLLYKVSPRDPVAFGSALVVMAVAALVACWLPAWRAMRTDPARALRD
jgi:predicted permease